MKIATLAVLLMAYPFVRFNVSPSMPIGIYVRGGAVHRGDVVEVCAPQPIVEDALAKGYLWHALGPCYGGTLPLVKVLAGVEGDVVDVSATGIAINGVCWPGSARRYIDRGGHVIKRWLTYGRFIVPYASVLLLGEHPDSWDSRTFGFLPAVSMHARWSPVFTFKEF